MNYAGEVVVLDSGSHSTKLGFSGESLPRIVIPTRYHGRRPIVGGRIDLWDRVQEMWLEMLRRDLSVEPGDHAVLLTESPGEEARDRERKAELFFEGLDVPRFSLETQSVLSLYADGMTSGIVVDVGEGHSTVVPVLQGVAIPSAIEYSRITGESLTFNLLSTLKHSFNHQSSVHRDIVNHIKDKLSYVSASVVPTAAEQICHYTLPDNTVIPLHQKTLNLANQIFGGREPLQESVLRAMSSHENLPGCNISLSGGTTDCPGFRQRMCRELRTALPAEYRPCNLTNSKVALGMYRSWVGGSVLTSLSSFTRMSISKDEYQEYGPGLINRRCVMEQGYDDIYALYSLSGA